MEQTRRRTGFATFLRKIDEESPQEATAPPAVVKKKQKAPPVPQRTKASDNSEAKKNLQEHQQEVNQGSEQKDPEIFGLKSRTESLSASSNKRLEKKNEELQSYVEALEQRLEEREEEDLKVHQELVQQNTALLKLVDSMNATIRKLRAEQNQADELCRSCRKENQELKDRVSQYEDLEEALKAERRNNAESNQLKDEEILRLQSLTESLSATLSETSQQLSHTEAQVQQILQEVTQLEEVEKVKEDKIQELQQQKTGMEQKHQKLQSAYMINKKRRLRTEPRHESGGDQTESVASDWPLPAAQIHLIRAGAAELR
nr:PREDICTED: myosin heavy chain, clone 203-like [Stegastes partitus]